ncbi:Eco57I restriction-modification methylase domain-containing protein [Halobacillus sp. K22]|uniref:Eco57I restriction-modification methylase domain-containing protein n=1 Tax=Halobacillus sp. K22 TaxID=3457431 RepID=UPI003FCE2EEE
MYKLVELLSKHWDHTFEQNDALNPVNKELKLSIGIGRSILINNLKAISLNDNEQKEIINIYDQIFEASSDDIYPLDTQEVIDPIKFDVIGRVYESHIHNNGTRKSTGQFYSPTEAVNYIVRGLSLEKEKVLDSKNFIDIACGTGVFLIGALKEYKSALELRGVPERKIIKLCLDNIYGLDINPVSCMITKINIFNYIVLNFKTQSVINVDYYHFNIYNTDSLENRSDIFSAGTNLSVADKIKQRSDEFVEGFDYILGNPPYLEAKTMPKELKEICRANYKDDMFGAFDLYMAFLAQCNRLVSKEGIISLILPNKFTVAKYAKKFRGKLLSDYKLLELVDLSEMDIFNKAGVYPIIFSYQNSKAEEEHKLKTKMSVTNYIELFDDTFNTHVPQTLYEKIGEMNTFFCLPRDKSGDFEAFFVDLFNRHETLSSYLEFRSTVSFHKKGLREQFVKHSFENEKVEGKIKKYLGGLSYSKKNEVSRYSIDWNGFYINYDNSYLKSIGNSLPPIENFERPKIIFCQHAKEIAATFDESGEWVSKDVFPIAYAKDQLIESKLSIKYFTGLLNSILYSFIYGIVYKGIQISSGYYHYLPTWMKVMPIIIPSGDEIVQVEKLVDQAVLEPNNQTIVDKINEKIFDIYKINKEQRKIMYSFFNYSNSDSPKLVKS